MCRSVSFYGMRLLSAVEHSRYAPRCRSRKCSRIQWIAEVARWSELPKDSKDLYVVDTEEFTARIKLLGYYLIGTYQRTMLSTIFANTPPIVILKMNTFFRNLDNHPRVDELPLRDTIDVQKHNFGHQSIKRTMTFHKSLSFSDEQKAHHLQLPFQPSPTNYANCRFRKIGYSLAQVGMTKS